MPDELLLETMRQRFGGLPQQLAENADFTRLILPMLRADFSIVETYSYAPGVPLACPILAMGGTDDRTVSPAALAAWRAETEGHFSLRMFPGGHFFVHDSPQPVLAAIARTLESVLSRFHLPSGTSVVGNDDVRREVPRGKRDLPTAEPPWLEAPLPLSLPRGEVHLWSVPLDLHETETDELSRVLSEDEKQRAARFREGAIRNRFIVGRARLRQLLAKYLRLTPEDMGFRYGEKGKPRLAPPWDASDIRFNISHCQGLALFGIARNRELGVDVERVDPGRKMGDLVRRYFSTDEQLQWAATPEDLQPLAFFLGWTRKEAWLKALGSGLAFPLDRFTVSLAPGAPARLLAVDDDPDDSAQWWLDSCEPSPGFVGALAVHGGPMTVRRWRWT